MVDKLEAMFQKAQVDMEYIEKQLRLDFLTNAPGNAPPSQNPLEKVTRGGTLNLLLQYS